VVGELAQDSTSHSIVFIENDFDNASLLGLRQGRWWAALIDRVSARAFCGTLERPFLPLVTRQE
jgi:hypothetical protein